MRIDFMPTKKQAEALSYLQDNETTEIGFWGAAWWAKSYLGAFRVWSCCMKYPWARFVIGRKELINLKRTTLYTYYEIMKNYKVPLAYQGKLNWQTNIIRFPNWSEIVLLDCATQPGDPTFTRFWSLNLTGAFIDEANEVDAQAVNMIKTRLWRQNHFVVNGKEVELLPKILETFNPNKGHVYDDYYKPYKTNTMPSYRKFIPALAGDNPYLPESYIQQLERADEITKQRLLYGNFDYDDTPGKLFRRDEISDLFTCNVEQDDTTYITCDVARLGEDKTVIYVWKGLDSIKQIRYNWKTTDQTVDIIKDLERRYNCRRSNIAIDSDWVWGGVADQLRGCVNFVNNASPIVQGEEKRNYANLKTQCYFKLKYHMEKREVKVECEPDFKEELERELDNILLKNVDDENKVRLESKEDMKKRIGGKSPDCADALMMRMYRTLTKPKSSRTETDIFTVNFDDYLY